MNIYDLKDVPEHLNTLARWHHDEWQDFNPGQTLADRITKMTSYLDNNFIPTTYVGLANNKPVGSAAIIASDMETHKELSPWLASVFVAPEHRRKGYASQLINHLINRTREQGIDKLYLFTPDQAALYAGLGWEFLQEENYKGEQVVLMEYSL